MGRVMLAGGQPQDLPVEGGPPYGCKLMAIGMPVVHLSGAIMSEQQDCKDVLTNVISSWIEGEKENGTINELSMKIVHDAGKSESGEPLCPPVNVVVSSEEQRLGARHL